MVNVTHLVDNIDEIMEGAKQIKSAKTRYESTLKKEREAREAVKELQREAHAITTAMVNNEEMAEYRDLQVVQREMQRAHNKVDAAIDKSNVETEAMEQACEALEALMSGKQALSENAADDSDAAPDLSGLVVEYAPTSEEDTDQAVNA